jgi:hypothetical protein
MDPEPLKQIHRKFHNEWLLIRVTKTDRYNIPLEGIVLHHSPSRKEISAKQRGLEGKILIEFVGDFVPKGMEVILFGNFPL